MQPFRHIAIAAAATVLIAATPAVAAQDDNDDWQERVVHLMKTDTWCPEVMSHPMPSIMQILSTMIREAQANKTGGASTAAMIPLFETLHQSAKWETTTRPNKPT